MQKTQIVKYSHFFVIRNPTRQMMPILYEFAANYTSMKYEYDPNLRKKKWMADKTYAIYVDGGSEFRFHLGQWVELIDVQFRNRVDPNAYEIVEMPLYEPATIDVQMRPGFDLYPEQEEAKEFALQNIRSGSRMPQISIPTGGGKTVVASHVAAELKQRIGVVVLAGYVEKWITDLSTYLTLDKDEIGVIKGGKNLILASRWAETEEPPKALVFSMDTMMTWFDLYEKDRNNPELDKYGCKPWELYQSLGIGLVIFDEMHQHLHKVYRTNTYLHAPGSINLSATLIASDPMRRKVQNVMFPKTIRFEKIKMKKYITCHGCAYQIVDMANSGIRTSEFGNTSYSHNAFEESILKNKVLGRQYVDMILKLIEEAYIDRRLEGDKCIVYVFRKSFAYELVEHLEKRYPELVIRTYVEGQPDENIKESDICLTTLGSGSTGHDVKGLRVAINTVSIDSPVANLQALGRLREFKSRDHDNDVHFYYLYCSSIPKHVEYHENKKVLYADRLKEYQDKFLTTLYPTDQR